MFSDAVQHYRAGRLSEAEQLCRQILAVDARHADALHLLGVIAYQVGRHDVAVERIGRAIALRGDVPFYHANLGNALKAQGKLEAARGAYERALALKPDYAEAHNSLGLVFHAQGKLDEAVACYGRALSLKADFVLVHYNLGLALQAQGKLDDAIACFRRALALQPNLAEAHNNLGLALQAQGALDDAIACFRRALELKPELAVAHNNLGRALHAEGKFDDAAACYGHALDLKPDFAMAHNNLGLALHAQGKRKEAAASLRRAVDLQPHFAEAHYYLGNLCKDQSKLDEAVACYCRALELKPDFIEAYCNLGIVLLTTGDAAKALDCALRALAIQETPEVTALFVRCVESLDAHSLDLDVGALRNLVFRALSVPWGRPSNLAAAAIGLIKLNPGIAPSIDRAVTAWPERLSKQELFGDGALAAAAKDPLLHCLLKTTPVSDVALERFLTGARRVMLDSVTVGAASADCAAEILAFYAALAQQSFINEYVFAYTDNEFREAQALRDSLIAALESGAAISPLELVAVAAYFPLDALPETTRLLERAWPTDVIDLLTQQVREPAEERCLQAAIPSLTTIEDEVSLLVQEQYEENPYPRWTRTAAVALGTTIDDYLRRLFPLLAFDASDTRRSLDILIAGCGTGQHSIDTARRFKDSKILAIDLSRKSLAYARRKTLALGIDNIEYAHADILKLRPLTRAFDVIEAMGVLHHLTDYALGWRVLLSLLRPRGFMRLGFYSALGRRHIVAARRFIAQRGFGDTAEDIRRCRQEILDQGADGPLSEVRASRDFFTTSACRDLLFHVQEHRLTLPDIAAFLAENKLTFLGFDIDPPVARTYAARFPADRTMTDLGCWHIFETENPHIFAGMYQFWVQKAE